MKKYILFQVMLSLCVIFSTYAMEIGNPGEPDKSGICYLHMLPREILDLIARFLMCDDETDQEFIERILAEVKEKESESIKKRNYDVLSSNFSVQVSNMYQTKSITLAQKDAYRPRQKHVIPSIWLFDSDKCYIWKDKLEENCNNINCDSLALSPCGTMFAFSHFKSFSDTQSRKMIVEVIKIDKKDQQGEEEGVAGILIVQKRRELDCGIFPNHLAFNKQGNALIAYTGHFDHKIFPLKVIDQNEPPVIIKSSNKLQDYLRDKFVCRTYIKGIQ